MILILSIYDDPSTNHVIDWLTFKNEKVLRVNTSKDIFKLFEKFNNIKLSNDENSLRVESINSVWFRRSPIPNYSKIFNDSRASYETNRFLTSENNAILDLLYILLQDRKWLNDYKTSRPRKIDQLLIAKEVGLQIPNTAIICTKSELTSFLEENGSLILKPLQDPYPIPFRKKNYMQYTSEVSNELINILPNSFYPCLFQQKINKNLEIRTFYLNGKCFSMAICSSFDKQTRVDFRRYNDTNPNRKVPYQLPKKIEKKYMFSCADCI